MLKRRPRRFLIAALVLCSITVFAACGSDKDNGDGSPGGTTATTEKSFGSVQVSGEPLTKYASGGTDDSVGTTAPVLTIDRPNGVDSGTVGGTGRPTLVVFVAHWCPHCQAEVPVIVKAVADHKLPDIRLVAVATGTNPDAPNFPPVAWLSREAWPGEILLDDQKYSAANAYGLSSYPYLVAIDASGKVTARSSGELSVGQIAAVANTAL